MRILLDTHLVYRWFYKTSLFPTAALEVTKTADEVFVSSVSIWEIAIKVRLNKISADPERLVQSIAESDFQELPVWSRHALRVASLPMHHSDPFDRLLIAQALSEPLHFLTADSKLKPYSDLVICV